MKLTLTHQQMLDLWRLKRYHEPVNDPLTVTVEDGFGPDTDRLHAIEMKAWYLRLLDTAPAEWLPTADLHSDVALRIEPDGSGVIQLPEECHRVISVALDCWEAHPRIITDPDSPLALLQRSPLTRGGLAMPVVIHNPGELRLFTPAPGAKVTRLCCVVEPLDGSYIFDEQALSSLI